MEVRGKSLSGLGWGSGAKALWLEDTAGPLKAAVRLMPGEQKEEGRGTPKAMGEDSGCYSEYKLDGLSPGLPGSGQLFTGRAAFWTSDICSFIHSSESSTSLRGYKDQEQLGDRGGLGSGGARLRGGAGRWVGTVGRLGWVQGTREMRGREEQVSGNYGPQVPSSLQLVPVGKAFLEFSPDCSFTHQLWLLLQGNCRVFVTEAQGGKTQSIFCLGLCRKSVLSPGWTSGACLWRWAETVATWLCDRARFWRVHPKPWSLESGVIVQVTGDRGLPDSTGQGVLGKIAARFSGARGLWDSLGQGSGRVIPRRPTLGIWHSVSL